MLLDMSMLNQNNKRLSRLAIISEHVAADKRKRFGTVRADFCQAEFSFSVQGSFFFFLVPVYSFWTRPRVSFSFRAVYSESQDVVLISGCFDANGGCAVGGACGLMSSKCSRVAERRLLLLTGDEAFAVGEIGGGLAHGGCPSWLISRCVWEHVGVARAQPQCFRK